MTRRTTFFVPDHVENEQAYIRATEARIAINARKGRRTRWFVSNPDAQRCEDFLLCTGEFERIYITEGKFAGGFRTNPVVEASLGNFRQSMEDALHEYGALTDKQTAAVIAMIKRAEERLAQREERKQAERDSSKHVGVEGERRMFDLTVTFTTGFETQFGWTNVIGMTDADGNAFVYKGSSTLKNVGGSYELARGDRVVVTATIAHGERDGVKQTLLKRPKQK